MSTGKSALIIGATGQVGGYLLKELLSSSSYTRVGEYGRRVTDPASLTDGKDKLEQKTINFDKIEEAGLKNGNWDVVFITLGTTAKNAGSSAAFEKIDREYVLAAAREAKSQNAERQRLVYLSSTGANSNSYFLYPKSKGLTEEGLAALGYGETIVFRPGFLAGTARPEFRPTEKIFGSILGVFSSVSSSLEINIATLAKSIAFAGKVGSSGLPTAAQATKAGKEGAPFTVIGNAGAIALAKEASL